MADPDPHQLAAEIARVAMKSNVLRMMRSTQQASLRQGFTLDGLADAVEELSEEVVNLTELFASFVPLLNALAEKLDVPVRVELQDRDWEPPAPPED